MAEKKISNGALSWIILILLSLVWGSSYILIKKGLEAFEPVQLACLRVSLSGLAFVPLYLYYRKKIDWKDWKAYVVVGLFGTFIPAFLYAVAQTHLNSSITGVLGALTPLNTILIGAFLFGVTTKWNEWLGVLIGLFGAIFLVILGQKGEASSALGYGFLVFIATACYGYSSNTVKAKLQNANPLVFSTAAFILILPPALLMIPLVGVQDVLATHPMGWTAFGYIILLSLLGTVAASVLFFYLVQLTNPVFASTVSYLIPMVALFWGQQDGEFIGLAHFVGMCIILAGVYLTRKK